MRERGGCWATIIPFLIMATDPFTLNALAIIENVRKLYGQDGKVLSILNFGPGSGRGYVSIATTSSGFVLHPKRPDAEFPTLEIVITGDITDAILQGIPGTQAGASAFALDKQVFKKADSGHSAPVGNPRVYQYSVVPSGEILP